MNLLNDAITFKDVSKIYPMYTSKWQMVKGVLGFKVNAPNYYALKNINLNIKKGERIGLVGRNGAGKSTLLKLITGNFAHTSGEVVVNGSVQALMNTGIGFHPEFTGLQNIKSSLLYNGLNMDQFEAAIEDIIDFVELGEFLDRPFKTYSLGMQSRLFFAVATAIKPEILIIDEVLGAGDAYFSAKSANRMNQITNSGCTLILVSHSTQQVLQFCDQAIWLESGEIITRGKAIEVVKDYEMYTKKLELEYIKNTASSKKNETSIIHSKWLREKLLQEVLQNDGMLSHQDNNEMMHDDKIKISRWPSHDSGLKIHEICLKNREQQEVYVISTGEELNVELSIKIEEPGEYDVYFAIVIYTEDGRLLTRLCSDKNIIKGSKEDIHTTIMRFDKLLFGQGKFIFSAGIYKVLDLNDMSTARYYDLLSRSYEINVQAIYNSDTSLIHHPVNWISKSDIRIEESCITFSNDLSELIL